MLLAAQALVAHFDIQEHFIIDVNLGQWGGSSLTDVAQDLPQDGVNDTVIPSTYVPGRNTVFIALALSLPLEFDWWFTAQSMAYGVVLFSLFVQAPTLPALIRRTVS